MPGASYLQSQAGDPSSQPVHAIRTDTQLELQTPSSTLCQHLDPEALPRPDFFETLDDLHLWYQMQYGDAVHDHLEPCSKHTRSSTASSPRASGTTKRRPKLVVCHDFQGGYNESPSKQGYTLEHMHLVDTFIYFSHKRVSIPPLGWLAAASRTGTKVLGTLIFEWAESVPDMARLLRGPERKAMPLRGEPCFSPQYAIELIELALHRGFSGYLVNVEVRLDLGFSCSGEAWPTWVGEQAKFSEMHRNAERLRGWVHYLREEGTRRFIEAGRDADDWEVMWYDSVVYPHGQIAWQDALTEHNIPFFQSAHTFFTNYTWARPPQPLPPGQLIDPGDESPQTLQLCGYGLTGPNDGGFHPHLLLSAAMADSVDRPRDEVYVGIDVFGRNCWGGLKAWKSFDMIGPQREEGREEALGLSVALFAPGWTWEEENAGLTLQVAQSQKKRSWSDWWHIDQAFWIGLPTPYVPANHRVDLATLDIKPVQSYFDHSYLEPPRLLRRSNPLGFYTNFSFGSGNKWFDRGQLVHDWSVASVPAESGDAAGFTDMGVSMPKPDLLFAELHGRQRRQSKWLQCPGTVSWRFDQERVWAGTASFVVSFQFRPDPETPASHQVLIPLCSAVIPPSSPVLSTQVEWQFTIVYDSAGQETDLVPKALLLADILHENPPSQRTYQVLGQGWKAASIRFQPSRASTFEALTLGFELQSNTGSDIELRIGALQLSPSNAPSPSPSVLEVRPAAEILEDSPSNPLARRLRASILTWPARKDISATAYCNVWVQAVGRPYTKIWLGTSTREAKPFEFCLPNHLALPAHLAQAEKGELEFVITSLDIGTSFEVAKGPAKVI